MGRKSIIRQIDLRFYFAVFCLFFDPWIELKIQVEWESVTTPVWSRGEAVVKVNDIITCVLLTWSE